MPKYNNSKNVCNYSNIIVMIEFKHFSFNIMFTIQSYICLNYYNIDIVIYKTI